MRNSLIRAYDAEKPASPEGKAGLAGRIAPRIQDHFKSVLK
jgi:hypothetical protein